MDLRGLLLRGGEGSGGRGWEGMGGEGKGWEGTGVLWSQKILKIDRAEACTGFITKSGNLSK